MKIAIVYVSYTGNTKEVAFAIERALKATHHEVSLFALETNPHDPKVANLTLKAIPSLQKFDGVVLGSPVHGFGLSIAMNAFLKETSLFQGKKVYPFVTQFFPFAWMGGSASLKAFKKLIQVKDGIPLSGYIINWSRCHRNKAIQNLVESCVATF
ncbi:MAG: flavodoxin domain-containing protein [Bacilli bacterium]